MMPCLQGVVDMHDAGWAHLDLQPDSIGMAMQPDTALVHSYIMEYGFCQLQGAGKRHSSATLTAALTVDA